MLLWVFFVWSCLVTLTASQRKQAGNWQTEATGESNHLPNSLNKEALKQKLLNYVFQTDEISPLTQNDSDVSAAVPYVMTRLYDLLADRRTGQQKLQTPFDVDVIRGLEDYWETERRMQFWFNATHINSTEDIIEAYFHIFKRKVNGLTNTAPVHTVSVSLYRVLDEENLFESDGSVGAGAELLERQQVSAYTSQWLVFKTNLKQTAKDWVRTPSRNKGLLITAEDSKRNHVNGSVVEFIQRGEQPHTLQPLFVIYTDVEKKKNKQSRRLHRTNIDHLVENFLNQETGQGHANPCNRKGGSSETDEEDCLSDHFRKRRSLLPKRDEEDAYQPDYQGDSSKFELTKHRRRHRSRDLTIEAFSRRTEKICQKKPLYIAFQALGWGKWIVAPEGINANFCDGICPFPLTGSLTGSNHAVLQSISNYYYPDKVKPPCCVPEKLATMSILYHQNDKTVTMKNYDNMIVESCGCR